METKKRLYYKGKIMESTYFSLLMKAHTRWDGAEINNNIGLGSGSGTRDGPYEPGASDAASSTRWAPDSRDTLLLSSYKNGIEAFTSTRGERWHFNCNTDRCIIKTWWRSASGAAKKRARVSSGRTLIDGPKVGSGVSGRTGLSDQVPWRERKCWSSTGEAGLGRRCVRRGVYGSTDEVLSRSKYLGVLGICGADLAVKDHGEYILQSIDEGPFKMGRCKDEIASGSELTKDDRESHLYDEFEHFRQHKGENIHDYYVRFTKLINNMRHIKMTMPKIQLNSKFVNNMLLEWGRFVTAVKLNMGLKKSNHDQLYAYLKQHELHANENKMLMERLNQHSHDPPALVSNVSPYQYPSSSSVPPQPSYIPPVTYQPQFTDNTQLDIDFSLVDELLDNLTKQNGRVVVQNVQGRQNRVQRNNAKGVAVAGNGGAQYRASNANSGQGNPIKCYNYNGIAQENGVDLDEEQLLFLAAPTAQTMFMDNLSSADPVYDEAGPSYDFDTLSEVQDHDNCLNNMNESHEEHEIHNDVQPNDVVDSDTEYMSNSNIISYEQYVQDNEDQVVHSDISSVPNDAVMIITNDIYEQDAQCVTFNQPNNTVNASLTAKLARYKELAKSYEKRAQFKLTERELMIDTQMRMIIKDRNVKEESLQKELHFVKMLAIGYKNPFYLSKAKQVQPALYNGHEIVKTNHARALVHDSEDTLEIAETTKKQMIENMKDPEYWSDDLLKMTAKTLKEKAKSAKPITAMAVYPPNTPAKLVPKVLPTKSQVQVNIFSLVQLFLEFDKPCKKRITPTGLTEGEMGFEQIKTCYLTEVIPFFKTIKEHFKRIQKALINEIKEMKEVFDQMEAEVDQHAVYKKCGEIDRKNLLIENENLIVECLFKDVFYTATDFVLIVSRFSAMHDAYTKYQHLKERFENKKSVTSSDAPVFESVFEIGNLKEQLQGRGNTIRELKEKISRLQKKHSEADPILDFNALDSQNKELNAKVNALQDLNEHFRVENEKVKQHYKELYDLIKLTRAKTIKKTTSLLTEIETKKAQIKGKMKCVTMLDPVKPKVLAPVMYAIDVEPIPPRNKNNREVHLEYLKHLKESVGTLREIVEEARVEKPLDSSLASACLTLNTLRVKDATVASGSKPRSNTKKDRTLSAKSDKKKVEDHSRNNKSSVKQKNRVDSSISYKRTVINSNSNYVCKTCNKCLMSFNHDKCVVKSLKFVKKPLVNKVWRVKPVKQVWQATGKLFTNVGFQWQPTGRKFTLGEQCPLTRFTESKVVPVKQPKSVSTSDIVITERLSNTSQKPLTRYQRKNKQEKAISTDTPTTTVTQSIDDYVKLSVVQIVLWYLDSGCSKHMTGDRSRLRNFVKKFIGTVRFGNDHFGAIMGYGDYVIGDSVISRVYYVEGLGHNLFSVGQFCDSDLEVAFRKHSCYVRDVNGVDLIKGNHGTNLYTILPHLGL
ncbi:hypothetical protein Tco_1507820 [Tanacetum coccineum]